MLVIAVTSCDNGDSTVAPPERRPDPVDDGKSQPSATFETPDVATPTPGRVLPITEAAWADGLPPLIVSNGSAVDRYRRGARARVGTLEGNAYVAFSAGAGSAVAQHVQGKRSELVRLRRAREPQRIDTGRAYATLFDVAMIDGARRMLWSTFHPPERGETSGYLYIEEIGGGRRRRLHTASGPEFGMTRASYGGDTIVASAWSDLTERFLFLDRNGEEIEDKRNPTDDLPYGSPPYMSDAVLSPDGTLLAYLEGPDFDQAHQQQTGDWVAVILDQRSGRESLRVHVSDGDECVPRLDFNGRWLVVSRAGWKEQSDGPLVCEPSAARSMPVAVIDSEAEDQRIVVLEDVKGIATIDQD